MNSNPASSIVRWPLVPGLGRGAGLMGLLLMGALTLAACAGPGRGLPADFRVELHQGQAVLGGEEVAFSSLFDQEKPVALNFWAGLCPPCRAEMPDFQAVSDAYADRLLLFGLDIGPFVGLGSRDDGLALLQELDITYPTGTTFDREVVASYRVLGMPTTVFLTPDGRVHRTWVGLLTEARMVEELLEA